ncbi:MAG: MASE3 domain-containing protein [bacterium]
MKSRLFTPWSRYSGLIVSVLLVLAGLYLMNYVNGLLAHSLVEIFGIIVAGGIFMTGWNSRQFQDNNFYPFLGVAYLFIGGMEVLYLLSYSGLMIFPNYGSDPNLTMQFWIAARFIESISFLIAPLFIGRKLNARRVFTGYITASFLVLWAILSQYISPIYFIEGAGSTLFGRMSRLVICLILLASITHLIHRRREFEPAVLYLVVTSIIITISSELIIAFFAVRSGGPYTLTCLTLNAFSFYLIYKAIVETGMMRPYQLLFRNLKRSEELLRESASRCEISLEQSKRELTIRNQISDIFLTVPDDRMYADVLHIILQAMDSRFGFFGYINQDGDMVFPSMTREIWDECRIPDKKIVFPRREWGGIWGQALVGKRTIRSNEPGTVPRGHIPITRTLIVPIIHSGKVIGEIAVANKATDYTDKDQELLETIVNSKIAPILYARLESECQERERQRAEESIRSAYAELDQIFNTAADGMRVVDKNFTVIRTNKTFSTMAGLSQEEMVGKKCHEVFPGSACHTPDCPLIRILHGEEHIESEVIKERLDGRKISCLVNATPFRGPDGELIGAVEDLKDITERKQMMEELCRAKEEAEAKYLALVEQANDGVAIIQDEAWKFVNRVMTEIIGYTVQEMMDRPFWEVVAPESRDLMIRRYRSRLSGKDTPSFYEARFQAKDGTIRDIEISAGLVQYHGKPATLGIFRDVTSRKRMENELLKAQKLESVGLLAGGIAHDFNNLLAAIIGNLSLIEMYLKSGGSIFEPLKNTERASQQARELTQQLLTFSKGGNPVRKTASIANLLRDAARLALSGSNVTCRLHLPDNLWWAEIDEGQISQVINNLLINADQAMPEGGTIELQAENVVIREGSEGSNGDDLPLDDGRYIRVTVRDQGIGIPKEYLTRIFDPYFTTKQKGSGLGLAICYSIVRKHAGHITVESKVGVGTSFSFYLPASAREAFVVEDVIEEGPIRGQGKILFMDDQEIIRDMAEEMLLDLGYEVELAREGQEAVEMYKKARESGHAFDAVILDLTIPGGMGGDETIRKLLEIDPKVNAIVSSGYSGDPIVSEYRQHGFQGVVAKPYNLEGLSRELHRVLKGTGAYGPKPLADRGTHSRYPGR